MRIIKLNAIDSTNSYLKQLCVTESVTDYTTVITKKQTAGRGQMGAIWNAEPSKNLTFSVFKELSGFYMISPFYISMVVTLSIIKTLKAFSIPHLSVKWPNDILSANKKICGVLIENVIKLSNFKASIIGIGLNVNQTNFKSLPRASSLKLISGNIYNIDELALNIIQNLKFYFLLLKNEDYEVLKAEYESRLFRKNKPSTFKDAEGNLFSGYITSVLETGRLQILLEDEVTASFDLKDITLLY